MDVPAEPVVAVETVVIEAPRLPPAASDATFSLVRMDADTLIGLGPLDEALGQTPGVALFRRTSSLVANPTIQGVSLRAIAPSGAGRALVTLDGVPQNDPFGGWVIWSALPPEGLAGASIVRGAGAGPYGAGALTGVVSLDERDATNGLAAAELSGNDFGGARIAASGGVPGLLVTGYAESGTGYVPVRGAGRGPVDIDTTLDAWSLSARLQGEVAGGVAALRLGAYDEQRGGGVDGLGSDADGRTASLTFVNVPTATNFGWRLQAWVRDTDFQNRALAISDDRTSARSANDQFATPATGWGFNAAVRREQIESSWELGVDARFAEGESQELFRNLGDGFTRSRRAGGRTEVLGAYAEGTKDVGPWLVAGGVRLDRWGSSEGIRNELDLATMLPTLESDSSDRDGVVPSARLGVRRELDGGSWIRGAAYSGFRAPSLNELHRPFRVGNDITEANPELKPEQLYGVEFGVGGGNVWDWQATVFYNRLVDPVTNVTIGEGPGAFPIAGFVPAGGVLRQRQNAGAIDAIGLEADFGGELSDRLSVRGGLLATWAEVDGGSVAPQLTGNQPAQTPRFAVSAQAQWRATERLALSGNLRFETARFEDDLNSRTLSAALVAGIRAGWQLTPGAEFYIGVNNVFDADVEVGERADGLESFAAPRMFLIGLSWRRR